MEIFRRQTDGHLKIDGIERARGSSIGQTRSINVVQPYYVGGLSADVAEKASGNLQVSNLCFGLYLNFFGSEKNEKCFHKCCFLCTYYMPIIKNI